MNEPHIVAVCISPGGIPKQRVGGAELQAAGLVGDGHDHAKHARDHRALLIQDVEKLEELTREGFALEPGVLGENLTVRGVDVQQRAPGTRLRFGDGPIVELTEPRKPCYVLDQIDPRLQTAVAGRCGFLARVIRPGRVSEGQRVEIVASE